MPHIVFSPNAPSPAPVVNFLKGTITAASGRNSSLGDREIFIGKTMWGRKGPPFSSNLNSPHVHFLKEPPKQQTVDMIICLMHL